MKLKLKREVLTDNSTIGSLYIDDKFECYTLEDVVRPNGQKVDGATAIPAGIYTIDLTFSNRFGRYMIIINGVPNFVGVRMHSGNDAGDTEGCILVGQTKDIDFVGNSRAAYAALWTKILKYISDPVNKVERITIEIVDAVAAVA